MLICKECQYATFDPGDPTYIMCLVASKEMSKEESLTSVQSRVVPAKRMKASTEACEHFVPKQRRRRTTEELRKTY
jgi:hypothetical protein